MTTWAELSNPGSATDFFSAIPARGFNAAGRSFDAANAWWLMELSRLIYRVADRKPFLDRAGLEELKFFDSKDKRDTQAFLVSPPSRAWAALVFRGTSTLTDFFTDADFEMTSWEKGGRVHDGFKLGLEPVWNEITAELETLPGNCALFYAGHSLGASLATLAASLRTPAAVYTFGSPLVGDRDFTRTLGAAPIFRVVDHQDIVTRIPPPIRFFHLDYEHAGEEHRLEAPPESASSILHFDEYGALFKEVFKDPGHFREAFRRWAKGLLALTDPPVWLADHAPINYVRRLFGMIPPELGREHAELPGHADD